MSHRDRTGRAAIKQRIYDDLAGQYQSISRRSADELTAKRQRLAEVRARFAAIDRSRRSLYRPVIDALHLARACAQAGAGLEADAYIAHDDVALVAAEYMASKHGGRLIYDAVEPLDPEQKTSGYLNIAPTEALTYYALLTRAALLRADTRFCTSEPFADLLRRRYGVPFIALPNYVDLPGATPSSSSIREDCGCTDSEFLLLYINSIYIASRFDQVISAIAKCDPSYHVVNVGDIKPRSLAEEFQAQIAQLDLRHRVHFLPAMPYPGYHDYISGCDGALVWLDNHNTNCVTNLHNRYLDALGAGLPILSSKNIAFAAINGKYDLGLIVPDQDPASLAAYITALRHESAWFRSNMRAAQSELRWGNVEERLMNAVAGCGSVAIITWKDPFPNQRIQRQVRTLRKHGLTVCGIGNLAGSTGEAGGAWFKIPDDLDADAADEEQAALEAIPDGA